jgi:hypothetical protein
MATLQSGNTAGTRIAAGDSVLEASKSVDMAPVTRRLAAFKKVHQAYSDADAAVKKATEALQAQQARVGEADVTQDDAVDHLAAGLAGDGLPRMNPFKPFGAPAPAALQKMGYGDEARALTALAGAVPKRRGLSDGTIAAAKAAAKAAAAVEAELGKLPKLEKARTAAMSRRDAFAQAWETAFAGLKRGARAAEDEGAKGLHAALFDRKAPPKKAAKKPAASAAPPA